MIPERINFVSRGITVLSHIVTDKTDPFTLSLEGDFFPFLKTDYSVLCYQPSCHYCFQLSIIYGLVVAKILFQGWRGTDDNNLTTNYPLIIIINIDWTVQRTAPQVSPRKPATCIAATTPGMIFRILNSVFFLNNSVTLTRYRPTP